MNQSPIICKVCGKPRSFATGLHLICSKITQRLNAGNHKKKYSTKPMKKPYLDHVANL